MNGLELHMRVRRGEFELDAGLAAAPGEVVALLGPNGAGKSTMLRAAAGLLPIDEGSVTLGGRLLDDGSTFVPARDRAIGVVFQDHRLFPHLSVAGNVAFGPRARGVPSADAGRRAREWLGRLGIGDLAGRKPRELSGGQAQRVALARALATEPAALLLDEPLAALDVATRAQVQAELRTHLASFAGPTVVVTHDPVEALLLADRLVVLEDGRVTQQGAATDVTSRPLTSYVARLVGMNLYRGTATAGAVYVEGGGRIACADAPDGPVLAALRPGAVTVHLAEPGPTSARNVWPATVTGLAPLGGRVRLSARADFDVHVDVTATAVAELRLAPGLPVWLSAKAVDVAAYPAPDAVDTTV